MACGAPEKAHTDYETVLKERASRIEELEGKIVEAAGADDSTQTSCWRKIANLPETKHNQKPIPLPTPGTTPPCSTCLNSPCLIARARRKAKEIMVPKIEASGLGDYTRNVGHKTSSITYELESETFNNNFELIARH